MSALVVYGNATPPLSVCMATYNGARYLAAQIDSILAQLCPDDELLVADDGSTDGTIDLLASYGSALRVVATRRIGGVVPNFSRVLGYANKALIVLADQDDVWLPGRLTCMRSALSNADLVLTNALVVDGQLQAAGSTLFDQVNASAGFWRNLTRNSFVGCCMGFRRSLLDKALPLPAGTPWHDWLLGLLASAGGRVQFISTPLLLYRRHGANASLTGEASSNSAWQMLTIRMLIVYAIVVCLVRWQLRRFRNTASDLST